MRLSTPIFPNLLACISLCILTLLPGLGLVLNQSQNISQSENRFLATLPQGAESITEYTQGVDAYLNDNFGFRPFAIKADRKLRSLWGDGDGAVLTGQDSWLFWSESLIWDSYQGRSNFSQTDLDNWLNSLENLRAACRTRGVHFAALIVPNKASIYADKAPARFGEKSPRNFYNYIFETKKEGLPELIDIQSKFLALKTDNQFYFKTDTHWTWRGAFEAYQAFMAVLQSQDETLYVLRQSELNEKTRSDFSGDLVKLSGKTMSETVFDLDPPKRDGFTLTLTGSDTWPPEWKTRIYERADGDGKTIVVIGDSFSLFYVEFLKHSFDKIVLIHHKLGDISTADIFAHAPDSVVFSPVERYANKINSFSKSGAPDTP